MAADLILTKTTLTVMHDICSALSSDSPLTPCATLPAILTAVDRRVSGGAILGPHEGISVRDAVSMYTYAGAIPPVKNGSKAPLLAGANVVAMLLDGNVAWEC